MGDRSLSSILILPLLVAALLTVYLLSYQPAIRFPRDLTGREYVRKWSLYRPAREFNQLSFVQGPMLNWAQRWGVDRRLCQPGLHALRRIGLTLNQGPRLWPPAPPASPTDLP